VLVGSWWCYCCGVDVVLMLLLLHALCCVVSFGLVGYWFLLLIILLYLFCNVVLVWTGLVGAGFCLIDVTRGLCFECCLVTYVIDDWVLLGVVI